MFASRVLFRHANIFYNAPFNLSGTQQTLHCCVARAFVQRRYQWKSVAVLRSTTPHTSTRTRSPHRHHEVSKATASLRSLGSGWREEGDQACLSPQRIYYMDDIPIKKTFSYKKDTKDSSRKLISSTHEIYSYDAIFLLLLLSLILL
jgi:hypothetical protein